ncbi:MAG: carbohydrate kinase [Lachnospiraceae bacterium]|nr:carbohydrate kinase [Lachnospiraceae bacterium]
MKVLCIGEILIDFTPVKGMTNTYTANPGGAPANVAVSVAKNGIEAGFLGCMGNDDFGKLLVKTLKDNDVKIPVPKLTDKATTTLAFVTLDETGDRSFTFARKPGADMLLDTDDVDKADISSWDIIHVGSVSQSGITAERYAVLYAVKKAKENGKMVSFDINYRDKIWSVEDCLKESEVLFPYTDFLKISDEELVFVGGEENIFDFMKQYDISVVVETLGSKGARIFYDGTSTDIPALDVKAVDTTGAGDAYWGGFLSSLIMQNVTTVSDLNREKLNIAGRYGAVSGGLCVQKPGGIPAIPGREEIERNLK